MPEAPSSQVNGVMPAGASGFAVAIADTLVAGSADLIGSAGSDGPNSDSTEPVEMRLFLRSKDETLSETWLYQYFPPAPDQRKYVDDRQMTVG